MRRMLLVAVLIALGASNVEAQIPLPFFKKRRSRRPRR